ncbi:MAG TPA: class A beta-lactamase-related serine hydrolase [Dehalococcoidia bacterium]|nr:class A beta-lactamase-related serine hydrolase [Dehalococcoidia bacterium]
MPHRIGDHDRFLARSRDNRQSGLYGFVSMDLLARKRAIPTTLAKSAVSVFVLMLAVSAFTGCPDSGSDGDAGSSGGADTGSVSENSVSDAQIATTQAELQAALDSWRENERITGASMSVFSSATGQIDMASGFAKLSIDPDRFPDGVLTIERPMFAGDLTHTLVAALVIQLVHEGTLALDAPIADWFPEIEYAGQITIRNMLEHTSGIPTFYTQDFVDLLYEQEPFVAQSPDRVIAVAAAAPGGAYFPPGTEYGYSKTNFLILGRIIEIVTGQPLEALLRERLFEPLGLDHTYLAGRERIPGGTPLGYEYVGPGTAAPTAVDGHVPQTPAISVISAEWASGALVSTPGDMTRLVQAIFESTEFAAIGREMLQIAEHPAQDSGPVIVDSGAGVFVWTENGRQVVGQFGFIYPFSAQFTYWPGSGTIVTVIANEVDSSRNPSTNFLLPVIENLTKEAKNILDEVQTGR